MNNQPTTNSVIEDLLNEHAPEVARKLIGYSLYVREPDGSLIGGEITETEAYTQDDAASHSFKGRTTRNEVMFRDAGHIYVYFTYGMHYCMNIVTGSAGKGEAVLIRSISPDHNLSLIQERRNHQPNHLLTNGPAKICQALNISQSDNGLIINKGRILLIPPKNKQPQQIIATPRIGITQNKDKLWRFVKNP